MGYFLSSLQNLESGLNSGLDPETAMSFLAGLQEQQQAKRDARLDARTARKMFRQGNKMQNMLLGASQYGLPLGEITTEANKIAELTGMPTTPRFLGGLISSWPQEIPEMGQFETSPFIDVEDRRALTADVQRMLSEGRPINEIRNTIITGFQAAYGPEWSNDIAESIDLLVRRAVGG